MRLGIALLTAMVLGLGFAACGGSTRPDAASSVAAVSDGGAPSPGVSTTPPSLRGLRGDEDDDDTAQDLTGRHFDSDADSDNDRKRNMGYYDADDALVRNYGHAPSASDARELTALVRRYFVAAAKSDGATACSLMEPASALSIPEDYGKPPGPLYSRGKTCAVVMSRLFEHAHAELREPVVVTGVRVKGSEGVVSVGSRRMIARDLTLRREHGAWLVTGLLGLSLP